MNGFTAKQPASMVPCSKNCNETPVHEKCIYEWKERESGTGSCPLCRAPLLEMSYIPPDFLHSARFACFAVRRDFVLRPVPPEVGMIRCFLRITRVGFTGVSTGYELYLQAPSILPYPLGPLPRVVGTAPGDQLLLVARKRFGFGSKGYIDISLDRRGRDFERGGKNHVGFLVSSFSGLDHTVWQSDPLVEVVNVLYSQNRVGRGIGPRKMRFTLPTVALDTSPPANFNLESDYTFEDDDDEFNAKNTRYVTNVSPVPLSVAAHRHYDAREDDSLEDEPLPDLLFGRNKEPYWLESIMAYSLDFHGRVTLPSNKNFILSLPGDPSPGAESKLCLQFGKTEDFMQELYTVDVGFPFSILQAMGVVLSACDRKLACA